MSLTPSELTRFHSHTLKSGGCLLWQAQTDKDGYGVFHLRRRNRRAHRVAYYHAFGPIPAGMVVHHVCRNRSCVNPQHLKCVTPRENTLSNSVSLPAINAQKTHCPAGHEFDRVYSGQRYCSVCDREKKKRLRLKWKAEGELLVGC